MLANRDSAWQREVLSEPDCELTTVVPHDRHVVVELSSNPKLSVAQHGEGKQATLADLRWDGKKLNTEEEKQGFYQRDLEVMHAEMEDDRMDRELYNRQKATMKRQNARDRQCKHRALKKELNAMKPMKPKKTVNDVCIKFTMLILFAHLEL